MKTLTASIKDNSMITEAIEATDGLRVPVMYWEYGTNPDLWQFGYLVFYGLWQHEDILKCDFAQDGSDSGSWKTFNWGKDIFVKYEDFDPTFDKLQKNKSKAIKELAKWKDTDNWTGFKMK